MLRTSWVRRLFARTIAPLSNRQHTKVRLSVTALEDRTVPTVSGFAYLDTNANGTRDPSELPAANLFASLTQNGSAVETGYTDAQGNFSFPGTWTGNLLVTVGGPHFSNNTRTVADDTPVSIGLIDPGDVPSGLGTIQGTAWNDTNANGVQDAGETVAGGVRITLFQESGTVASTVTDAQGHYAFSGLADGSYGITADAPGDIIEDGDDTTSRLRPTVFLAPS